MRLIDADGLMEFITEKAETEVDEIIASVCRGAALSMPTIDPVDAAGGCYCRDCKHRHTDGCPMIKYCDEIDGHAMPLDDDFCSYGEKEATND